MRFSSGKEMLDCIVSNHDLYNSEQCMYVFHYSEDETIAVYLVDNDEAEELKKRKNNTGEHWSVFLGMGGEIYFDSHRDLFGAIHFSSLDWCNINYKEEWEYV